MVAVRLFVLSATLLLGAVFVLAGRSSAVTAAPQPGRITATTDPLGKVHPLPPALEQKVQGLRAKLAAEGYEVARGYWDLWSAEDCKFAIQAVGLCYGNNPAAPYVMAYLPHWKDEFVDQRLHHAIAQGQRNAAANYRMGEREALVVLAQLPPAAKYFGMQTNVFTRQTAINPNDPIYRLPALDPVMKDILFHVSPNPLRMMLVASIGNSINNVVIAQRSGEGWGQQRFMVITPDEDLAESMTVALGELGVPGADVFTEPVSRDLVRLGLGPEADDLITYMRYARPDDPQQAELWRSQLPLAVLRVRVPSGSSAVKPFPIPTYRARNGNVNHDETDLRGDLDALVAAVSSHWGQWAWTAHASPFFSAYRALDLIGQHCLGHPNPMRGPMNCLGDTQDSDYQISPTLPLDDDSPSPREDQRPVVAIVGTLGTETGNATYTSVSVNRFPLLVGVQNINDTDLAGSAEAFAGVLQHDHRLFYVGYLARDCTGFGPWCREVPKTLVPRGEAIKVIQRNYINPGSPTGPDATKVLNPVAIVLRGGERPASDGAGPSGPGR